MMKGFDIEIQEKKSKLFNEWERFTSNEGESIESYYHHFLKLINDLKRNKHFPEKIASNLKYNQNGTHDPQALMANSNNPYVFPTPHQYQLSFNQNYLQQPMANPEDITDSTAAMNMALALMEKAFKLNYSKPTNNNQRISANPRNRQIAQPGMNMGQDRQMQMFGGNGGNQFRQYAGQNAGNLAGYNDVIKNQVNQNVAQNLRIQNVGNQNGLIGVQGNGNHNQIGNGNLVASRAEGNTAGQNGNQIRRYNCRGKEEAGIQLQAEEYDLMAAAADLDEIKEVNANCILMANLQQASISGPQTDSAPVYDTDGLAEYTELLEPIPESHQVPQNDNDVNFKDTSVEQGGEIVEQQPVNFEETRALYESLYQNLAIEVEKVNSINRKLKETNADLSTELARYKNQERCFERSQEKFKFVGDFKSLANEADTSLAKQKALELEIKRFLKAVNSFENCIIKKETGYAKLWNDWYKKYDECKYDKISYDKAYKDMQQKIERLQAQLGDLKGKSKDTSSVSDTRNSLSQKLEKKNVSEQKDNTKNTSENTKFAKQPIVENLLKTGKTNTLSKPVTSNSVSTPQEPKSVNNDKVIAPGMFRINPSKTFREEKQVPNTVSASARTKPITVSQPPVITKKNVNFDINGLSSTGVDNTKTRRPQPRSNTKNDRVPSASKSIRNKNKEAEVEEHHRNLLLSKNNKHISSACNNIKIDSPNVISKVVCAICKKYLIYVNHDKCLSKNVNGKNSCRTNQKAKVSVKEIQKKYQPKVAKPKKVGTRESLATPKPKKPRFLLGWSPTGKLFNQEGKLVDSSESKSKSNGDNACTSNVLEPKIKWFPNSTSLLDRNLEGVDLLKRDRSTNLYTINLHEMASASPICLMARASSTKSWLWH
nr:integrase, catalytic region, zinc finger, CCHC-type, peptidase aspartic, catalytic [Tanacetum cinerariifolium]